MRNRAKCKKCETIIESFHSHDYVTCKCGEISVDGGLQYYKASAYNFDNFIRVDDQDNEIPVRLLDKGETNQEKPIQETKSIDPAPSGEIQSETKSDDYQSSLDPIKLVTQELDTMIKNIEALPQVAMLSPVTHYDMLSVLLVLSASLRALSAK